MLSAFRSYHSMPKWMQNCSMVPWRYIEFADDGTSESCGQRDAMPFKPTTGCCGQSYTLKAGPCSTDMVSKLPISCPETLYM